MGRHLVGTGAALALQWLLLAGSPALAQFRPPEPGAVPVAPPPLEAQDADEALTLEETAESRTEGWEPLLVVEGVFEENVGFTSPPGPDDYFGSIQGSLTHWRRSARSEVRFRMEGAGYLYREVEDRNRADGAAEFVLRSRLSEHVHGDLAGRFAYGHTDSEGLLIASGNLFPLIRTISGDGRAGLTWTLGTRTELAASGSWQRIEFDSDVILDTELWNAGLTFSHRTTERGTLFLRANMGRVDDGLSTRQEPGASLGFSYRLAQSVVLDLSGGARRSETVAGVAGQPPVWDADLGAALTVRLQDAYAAIRYQRGLRPTIGLGVTQLTDHLGLDALVPIGRRLELIGSGYFAQREGDSESDIPRSRDGDAFLGCALRLARRLRLVLGYRFRYRDFGGEYGEIQNNRASVSLAWGPDSLTAVGSRLPQ